MVLLRCVFILSSLSVALLRGAEPSKVVFYRAVVPSMVADQSMKFSLDANVQRGLVLSYLLHKDECVVEKVGEAEVSGGRFALDKTSDVHFFLEGKDGGFTLTTTERKGGYLFSGTVKAEGAAYLVDVTYRFSYVMRRQPLGFDKDLAPDLAVGLPEMSTQAFTTKAHAMLSMPVLLGGGPDPDPAKSVLTFMILE